LESIPELLEKFKNAVSDKKWLMGLEVDFNAMLYVFIPF
jgi:hypothetical protein